MRGAKNSFKYYKEGNMYNDDTRVRTFCDNKYSTLTLFVLNMVKNADVIAVLL